MRRVNTQQGCFLCQPAPDLMYYATDAGVALCGLGPLTSGYSVAASRTHTRSAADSMAQTGAGFVSFVEHVRERLSTTYGSCLMTEHGRVPVCDGRRFDAHCYHAHFLLFPDAPAVLSTARPYFAKVHDYSSLADALRAAARMREYFLISPDRNMFSVMTRPTALIRQFSRMLVADALGQSQLANWRRHPRRDEALEDARKLKRTFQ